MQSLLRHSRRASPWKTWDRYWGNAVAVSEESSIPEFPETLEALDIDLDWTSGENHIRKLIP